MNSRQHLLVTKILRVAISVLILGVSMTANAGMLGAGGDSWKEEVLLHDGSKIIVKRSQTYGGRREPGQSGPVREHAINFALPGSNKTITWTSEYGEDLGRTNFNLLALHVLNGTPYVVAEPNLCPSYNKWGRSNPPYVFFKYDGNAWQRISLERFPAEFNTINVATNVIGRDVETLVSLGLVSAEKIKETNRSSAPEYKSVRDPSTGATVTPADAMLTRFTTDLWKLAQDDGMTMVEDPATGSNWLSRALILFVMQKYYNEKPESAGYKQEPFHYINGTSGSIQFDINDVAPSWHETKDFITPSANNFLVFLEQYYITVTPDGTGGNTVTYSPDKNYILTTLNYMRDWYVQDGAAANDELANTCRIAA